MKKPSADYGFKDPASLFTIFCLTIALVLIVILSFGTRFYYRPGIDDSFWGDLSFLFAIVVYALYFGISEAKRYYEKKENGKYQNAINEFKDIRKEVKERDFTFSQWLDIYYKREKKDYYMALLSYKTAYSNPYILDLDINEISNLEHPFKKDWSNTEFKGRQPTIFRSLTKEQLDLLSNIYKGKYSVQKIPDSYFKTYDSKVVLSEYKSHSDEAKKDFWYTFLLILFRLIMLFITQAVFVIFGIKMTKAVSSEEVLKNIYDTITRIMNLATGLSWGWMIGRVLVLRKVNKINYKTRVNEMFVSDKTFVGVSEEELAKQEYEDYNILKIEMKGEEI